MQTRKPLAGSLEAMGLMRFINERYGSYGGYPTLVKMLEGNRPWDGKPYTNGDIMRAFGRASRGSVRNWRARYELEKELENA